MSETLKHITTSTITPEWFIVAKRTTPPSAQGTEVADPGQLGGVVFIAAKDDPALRSFHLPSKAVRAQSLADVILEHWPADDAYPAPPAQWGRPHDELPPVFFFRPGGLGCSVVYESSDRVRVMQQGHKVAPETMTRTGIEQALERNRAGVSDIEARVLREVDERTKLRQVDTGGDTPGDYEAVLVRVETILAGAEPTCEVCKLYWPTRRQLPGGRTKLFAHLVTAGHVALELGLTTEDFRALADKRQHGVPLDAVRAPLVTQKRDALRDMAEGLQPMLDFARGALDVPERLARLGAVLAACEGASVLLEAIEHPSLADANATLAATQALIKQIALGSST